MTVRIPFNNSDFYFDGYLYNNLEIAKEQINNKDMDMIGIVDGYEGVGKSVMAQQVAFVVDPSFNLDRVVFSPEEFKEGVLKAKKGQAIVWDEAITGSFNREAIQRVNVMLVKMMAQIRQLNLFILVVLPTFYDLDRNLALWRTKFLIHVYFGNKFERGFFKFASLGRKKQLYLKYQKQYYYPKTQKYWSFYGRFVNHYTVNEKKYRQKNLKSFKETDYEQISLRKARLQRDSLVVFLYNMGFTQDAISEISDIFDEGFTQQAVQNIIAKHNKLQKTNYIIELKSKYGKLETKANQKKQNNVKINENANVLDDNIVDKKEIQKSMMKLRKNDTRKAGKD